MLVSRARVATLVIIGIFFYTTKPNHTKALNGSFRSSACKKCLFHELGLRFLVILGTFFYTAKPNHTNHRSSTWLVGSSKNVCAMRTNPRKKKLLNSTSAQSSLHHSSSLSIKALNTWKQNSKKLITALYSLHESQLPITILWNKPINPGFSPPYNKKKPIKLTRKFKKKKLRLKTN